jgi:hypothetical protein
VFAKLKSLFAAASGKKFVTWLGLAIVTFSAICAKLGQDWIHANVPWMEHVCTIAGYAGTILTAFGRGLADRRDPHRENNLA